MFVFGKNKKKKLLMFLFVFVVGSIAFFFVDTQPTYAVVDNSIGGTVVSAAKAAWGTVGDGVLGFLAIPFKGLVYAFFVVCSWFASAGIVLFEWIIKPENISGPSGLLTQPKVYEMWKFVRDFFNLFFILVLLYIAFTVVFQIQKDFKKALLSLVLAALFINFSFPVTRFLIDATNVPMYFFVNQTMGVDGKTTVFGTALSVSKIQKILLPGSESGGSINWTGTDFSRFLLAAIFMFIFSITIFILAVMFFVRLVALMILLVFASVGFAASIIPGMEQYSKMWWDNFWKYAIFGPAAALMLLVATRFFDAANDPNSGIFSGLSGVAGSAVAADPTFIASIAMFAFPIIILWFAMGLAQKFSIAGAASVTGYGQKFAKWVGKKVTYDNAISRGIGLGLKGRAEKTPYLRTLTPKFWTEGSKKREERIAGGISGGRAGYARVVENQHNKAVAEAEKKMEEERTNRTRLEQIRDDRSGKSGKAEIEAAVRLLSKKDMVQNDNDMRRAIDAMNHANTDSKGNPLSGGAAQSEKRNELIRKAGGEIYKDGVMLAQAIEYLGDDAKAIAALVDKTKKEALNTIAVATYNGLDVETRKKLEGKMKKEGAIQTLVRDETVSGRSATREEAVVKIMAATKPDDAAKVFKDPALRPHAETYLRGIRSSNPDRYRKINAEK